MEQEKIRLFVGGLASAVSAGDLQERFAPLGNVQSITIPPAKAGAGHRGFAYVDFVPATDASLRKLFSAYNGCKWRGGLLRIEKAKEHFADRLHHEWAVEAASLTTDPPPKQVEVVQKSSLTGGGQKQANGGNKGDLEASDLKIFFPRLRKLKNVPLTGVGKHKRSFQRVESSPLQLLLTCACEESLRCGSCDCSSINDGTSSFKEDRQCENDIAQAIEVERQRQLELLNRLFPSDSTCISLENQQVVELDDIEGKAISEHEGKVGSIERSSCAQTLLPTVTEKVKHNQHKHSLQRSEIESLVGKGHDEPFNSEMDFENEEIRFEDDSTSTAVARERAMQLELMRRLFPADGPSTREPEKVMQPEVSKAKKKQKLDASGNSANPIEPVMDGPRDTITDLSVHSKIVFAEINTEQQLAEHQKLPTKHEQERRAPKSTSAFESEDSVEGLSETILYEGDNTGPVASAEDQERQVLKSTSPVTKDALPEDDSEMILNVGDDSFSLAIAEEQEKSELKSLSVRANALMEKVSEMTRHISDNSLALANAEVRETQMPKSSQDVTSVDVLEDSEMTLNLGDDFLPLSKAEEQEKALVRKFSLAKHYNWTRTDGSRDPKEAEEIKEYGIEDSSKKDDFSDGSGDSQEVDEAEESEYEEHSLEAEDNSDGSSDAEEADEAEDNEREEHCSEESDEAEDNDTEEISSEVADESEDNETEQHSSEETDEEEDNEMEEHSSEEQDDSFNTKEYSEPIPPTKMPESAVAKALLRRREGESNGGKEPEEPSKWAALGDMCQFRAEKIMHPEENKREKGTEHVARSNKDADRPSLEEQDFQLDKSKTPSGKQTDSNDDGQKSENPPSSGQKLTRAAWKSLVGETGRVVFSLRQLTGLSLPETPVLTPRTQTIEDTYTQVEPPFSSKTLNQHQAKAKVAVSTAEKKHGVVRPSTEHKMNTAEYTNMPAAHNVFSSEVCPFMKSEDAEKEWLATKSELRTDYRAKQKYAARNVKKLWGRR